MACRPTQEGVESESESEVSPDSHFRLLIPFVFGGEVFSAFIRTYQSLFDADNQHVLHPFIRIREDRYGFDVSSRIADRVVGHFDRVVC